MKTRTARRHRRSGFSLAELMVVIVIIGLLAVMVVPNVMQKLFRGQMARAKADITTIAGAIDEFTIANAGKYPETLEVLVQEDETGHAYLRQERVPLDPWKNEYQYEPPSPGQKKYRLYSLGSDGEVGGEGDARDITLQDILNNEI